MEVPSNTLLGIENNEMKLTDAIYKFEASAKELGLNVSHLSNLEENGTSVYRASKSGVELRLIWDNKEEYLSLKISNGPDNMEISGFLELYGSKWPSKNSPKETEQNVSFESSLEYALELMVPDIKDENT